jgi:hypothetical protein
MIKLNSCSTNFTNYSALVFHAASTVVGKTYSMFLSTNISVDILNRRFSPRNSIKEKYPIWVVLAAFKRGRFRRDQLDLYNPTVQ